MSAEVYHFTLGQFRCITFNEGTRTQEAERIFAHKSAEDRARVLAEFGLTDGILPSAINVLYVDTGSHRVLVDSGLGQGVLYQCLQDQGIARDSIDTLIITHGHGDHINGILLEDDQLAFPNAQYFISRAEWDYWHTDNRAAAAQARVLAAVPAERMTQVEDGAEFLPDFRANLLPGHTPGMMGLLVESEGARMLHIADAAMYALQGKYPDWSPGFDADLDASQHTRRQIWQRAAAENLLVMGYHYPQSGRGYVTAQGEAWRWEPALQAG